MVRTQTAEGRRRSPAPAVLPARPIVRDFSGGATASAVTFDTRTAYDFLISLMIGTGEDTDLLPEDAEWRRRTRAALEPEAVVELDACFAGKQKGVYNSLPSLIVDHPEVRDAADLVALFDATGDIDLIRHLAPELPYGAKIDVLLGRALDGDAAAADELSPLLSEHTRAEVIEILGEGRAPVQQTHESINAWLPAFQEIESRIGKIIQRDIAGRAGDRATLDPSSLIERTTGGHSWLPESNVRRVIMAPSYFARPYNYIFSGSDWRMFCYPVADAALGTTDGSTPPQATIRLYRALGDATRMRILKLLTDRDYYLTELATQLELSKPTMKHHLALLRAAGLVTVTEEGSLTYYSLRRERLTEAGVELTRFLS
jgi:DNA-binding transcriptional ArsR family regulator